MHLIPLALVIVCQLPSSFCSNPNPESKGNQGNHWAIQVKSPIEILSLGWSIKLVCLMRIQFTQGKITDSSFWFNTFLTHSAHSLKGFGRFIFAGLKFCKKRLLDILVPSMLLKRIPYSIEKFVFSNFVIFPLCLPIWSKAFFPKSKTADDRLWGSLFRVYWMPDATETQ